MPESSTQSRKFKWKWVGIVFSLFLLCYLLPMLLASGLFAQHPDYAVGGEYESPAVHGPRAFIIGMWSILGVIIVSACAAFFARKNLLSESATSAVLLAIVLFVAYYSGILPRGVRIFEPSAHSRDLSPSTNLTILAVVVFLLSLVGAWLGERLRKALKSTTPHSI